MDDVMAKLSEVLIDHTLNDVYRLPGAIPELPGTVRLDGARFKDVEDLLLEIAQALQFPDYFGVNWDALDECLRDMSWWDGPVVVILDNARLLESQVVDTLAEIWRDAAEDWTERGKVFSLLIANSEFSH
jgi:RNAse (barnase) inhibitor barstar